MEFSQFESLPLLGILRGVPSAAIEPLAEVAAGAGLRALEITMNTENAAAKIAALNAAAQGRFLVGAGTVLSLEDFDEAVAAGAAFIVMPSLELDVVRAAVRRGLPVLPGALTPSEVRAALSSGATMVKVFPARVFGPEYFRDLLGPFDSARLLACGGIDEVTLPRYFASGAAGVAVGASVFRTEWLREGRWERIRRALIPLVEGCRDCVARLEPRVR